MAIHDVSESFNTDDYTKKKRRRIEFSTTAAATTTESGGWGDLPADILGSILEKLTLLSDYDRFGAVCVQWRRASLDVWNRNRRLETQLISFKAPLLLLPPKLESQGGVRMKQSSSSSSLFDVVQGKTVVEDFKLIPALPNSRGRYCGSSHGWLIMADESLSLTLVNPFYIGGGARCGGGKIRLPPLDFDPEGRMWELLDDESEYISELTVSKAVLSADPLLAPRDYVVIVLYAGSKTLKIIRSGDKDWTYVLVPSGIINFQDVTCLNDMIFAVVSSGELLWCEVTDPTPTFRRVASAPAQNPPLLPMLPPPRCYVVDWPQSTSHRLLLVCRFLVWVDPKFRTRGFKVFELVHREPVDEWEWVEMNSGLGDHSLFLGENHSTCISSVSQNFPRLQPNSIYFTDDTLVDYARAAHILHIPNEMGIFSLDDQTFRQYYDTDSLSQLVCIPTPIWFMPSFPGNWA